MGSDNYMRSDGVLETTLQIIKRFVVMHFVSCWKLRRAKMSAIYPKGLSSAEFLPVPSQANLQYQLAE